MTEDDVKDPQMLVLALHEEEYLGTTSKLRHLLDIAGSATRPDGPALAPLEEASHVLEYWCEKYSSPVAAGGNITVFIGRETDEGQVEPLARLDIVVADGKAWTTIVRSDYPAENMGPTCVDADEGVAAVAWKVLSAKGESL
jgi:hypothetical protein